MFPDKHTATLSDPAHLKSAGLTAGSSGNWYIIIKTNGCNGMRFTAPAHAAVSGASSFCEANKYYIAETSAARKVLVYKT